MKYVTCLAVTLTLAACGGGGGDNTSSSAQTITQPTQQTPTATAPTVTQPTQQNPAATTPTVTEPTQQVPAATASARGLYLETNTVRLQKVNFLITDALVLGFTGKTDANGGMSNLDGVFAGTGAAASGNYSANLIYYTAGQTPGTLTGSYAKAGNFAGTLTVGGVSQPLNASYPAATKYDFNKAATLSEITGAWKMNGNINVSIDSSGLLSGNYGSCTFGGAILPDTSSGKNVFLVMFADANTLSCGSTGGIKVVGEAVTYLLPNGQRQLLIVGLTSDASAARGMAGIR
jgi:hypothetical protein